MAKKGSSFVAEGKHLVTQGKIEGKSKFYSKKNWCGYVRKRLFKPAAKTVSPVKARLAESVCFECKHRLYRMTTCPANCYLNKLEFKPI